MQRSYDFHVHSWYSYDAQISPAEIFAAAEGAELAALAVTDHHNMDGFGAFAEAAQAHPSVRWVPAMEVSVETSWGWKDIVALGLPVDAPQRLAGIVDRFRRWQRDVNRDLLDGFEAMGVAFDRAQAEDLLNSWRPGPGTSTQGEVRLPNIALRDWLIAHDIIEDHAGFVRLTGRAFEAVGGKTKLPPAGEVLPPFKDLGGVLILAHPSGFLDDRGEKELDAMIRETGVDGIEAGHRCHSPERFAGYLEFARRRGLLVSGGTDVHFADELPLLGEHHCTEEHLAALLERLRLR